MPIKPNDLTDEQKDYLLKLAGPSDSQAVPSDIIDSLLRLGLLYYRGENHLDVTEEGERIYRELGGSDPYSSKK